MKTLQETVIRKNKESAERNKQNLEIIDLRRKEKEKLGTTLENQRIEREKRATED